VGLDPSELDASVTARVPTRTNRDDRYFADKFQAMPLHGYTRMFEKMLDHPNIKVMLNTDYREIVDLMPWKHMVYTGPVDAFFDYKYGKLPYRSLRFEHVNVKKEQFQPVGTVNYPNDYGYTRISEFKHITGQEHPSTSVVYEYPCAEGDPYYPVPQARERRAVPEVRGRSREHAQRDLRRPARDLQVLQHGPGGRPGAGASRALLAPWRRWCGTKPTSSRSTARSTRFRSCPGLPAKWDISTPGALVAARK
jgi:UDP-galactopyranose mutase